MPFHPLDRRLDGDLAATDGRQSMGELVQALEARGYVRRAVDRSDRRARLVRLTPKGRRAVRRAIEEIAEIESAWLERFGRAGFDVDVRRMLEAGLRER
jgi:DNA-binding MarR family transcriptional regulator